jgi:hypothetical protein
MSSNENNESFNECLRREREQCQETIFHPFPRLPLEIRSIIWQNACQRERIVTITLTTTKTVATLGERSDFYVAVDANDNLQLPSELCIVNREAREAAIKFYRVRIPCTFISGIRETPPTCQRQKPGTIQLNPEYDILDIHHGDKEPACFVMEFLHDLKVTYDPKRVGALNLAVNTENVELYVPKTNLFHVGCIAAFVETIQQLQEVYFMHLIRKSPYHVFNRSLPTMPRVPFFERLDRDSRPVAKYIEWLASHLESEWVDPRSIYNTWAHSLSLWDVRPSPQTQHVHLFAFNSNVNSRASAIRFAQDKHAELTDTPQKKYMGNGLRNFDGEEKDLQDRKSAMAVKLAFGFWLLPQHTISLFDDDGNPIVDDPSYIADTWMIPIIDGFLSWHIKGAATSRWPALALSVLP